MQYETSMPSERQLTAVYPGLFENDEVAVQYLMDENVLPIPQCPQCHGPTLPRSRKPMLYQCRRKACRASISLLTGSFFGGCKSVCGILRLCYLILAEVEHKSLVCMTGYEGETVTKWQDAVLELMRIDEESQPEDVRMMGGPNWATGEDAIVEIDESKFGKVMYGYGHPVAGAWVVGLIERRRGLIAGKFVATVVADRSAPTLEAIIGHYVRPGTALYSDMWKGYRTWYLNAQGILHRTVNHSENFVDPVTGVHTNTIEGIWQAVKKRVPKRKCGVNDIQPYLWRYMWARRHKQNLWARFLFCLREIRYDDNGPVEPVQAQVVAPVVHPVEVVVEVEEEVDFVWENNCVIS